jgi:hypothetical protein
MATGVALAAGALLATGFAAAGLEAPGLPTACGLPLPAPAADFDAGAFVAAAFGAGVTGLRAPTAAGGAFFGAACDGVLPAVAFAVGAFDAIGYAAGAIDGGALPGLPFAAALPRRVVAAVMKPPLVATRGGAPGH